MVSTFTKKFPWVSLNKNTIFPDSRLSNCKKKTSHLAYIIPIADPFSTFYLFLKFLLFFLSFYILVINLGVLFEKDLLKLSIIEQV